ncbi:MAG TPA: sodium:proline symporter, partial [Sphingomicrobium sp.]|nr:sodium:proline symporter [Sphingomicrobium sp.]
NGALAGMVLGAATVLFWIYAPVLAGGAALSSVIYEMVPGFLICGATAIIVSLLDKPPPADIVRTFEESAAELREARAGAHA